MTMIRNETPTIAHPPAPAAAPARPAPLPGRGLGVAGFVLSLLGAFAPLGFVLSIVSLMQGRRVHRTNGLAVAGTVVGAIGTILLVVVLVATITTVSAQAGLCSVPELIQLSCR